MFQIYNNNKNITFKKVYQLSRVEVVFNTNRLKISPINTESMDHFLWKKRGLVR